MKRIAFIYDGNLNKYRSHDLYRMDVHKGTVSLVRVKATLTPVYVETHSTFYGVPLIEKQSLEDVLF